MLLCFYSYLLRKPSPFLAVFLVPQVVLVQQQAEAIKMHTDLKVGMYWGNMGIDFWDEDMWKQQVDKYEVLVMTPAILLNKLRHSFFKLSMIKVLIMDECHHARGNHPYALIMKDFFHRSLQSGQSKLPRIFGMTASPIKTKDVIGRIYEIHMPHSCGTHCMRENVRAIITLMILDNEVLEITILPPVEQQIDFEFIFEQTKLMHWLLSSLEFRVREMMLTIWSL